MKRFLLSVAATVFVVSTHAGCTARDAWTGADKAKHFAAGVAIGSTGTLVFKDPWDGIKLGAAVALAKEMYDYRHPQAHTCSAQDFAVTVLGAVAGAKGTAWIITPRFIGYTRSF